jgi:hypothetical protein
VTNVTNVYNRTVVVNNTRNVSYNGPGGIEARPRPQEERFSREPHSAALAAQTQHEHAASQNRQLFAAENHGRPAIAATAKPGEFNGPHVQRARAAGEPYRAPKISPQEARGQAPGNRGFETPARNGGNENNRATSRPGNPEVRNNQPRNREQMSPRDNPRPNRQEKPAQNQQRAAQERAVNPNRAPARAEQRHNPPEQHH